MCDIIRALVFRHFSLGNKRVFTKPPSGQASGEHARRAFRLTGHLRHVLVAADAPPDFSPGPMWRNPPAGKGHVTARGLAMVELLAAVPSRKDA